MVILLIAILCFGIALLLDFFSVLNYGHKMTYKFLRVGYDVLWIIIFPAIYLSLSTQNNCCGGDAFGSAAFSPAHRLSIICVIIPCILAYAYCNYRSSLAPPLPELIVNVMLVLGLALNVVLCFHTNDWVLTILGPIPIIVLFLMVLKKNHALFLGNLAGDDIAHRKNLAYRILSTKPLLKVPLLLLLSLPVLVVLAAVLLLFGQKPDSMIRVFTETYYHGFSQWDYKCDNVDCGGHYLCSVAAKGHKTVVKPQRFGVRAGGLIVCNRQLHISNAFEELIQEQFPRLHKQIRKRYDKVGDTVHRYYFLFDNKLVCDIVYYAMKPLEWFFLFVLYTFDRKPENRIARQYTSGGKNLA